MDAKKNVLNLLGALAAMNFLTASPNGPSEFAYKGQERKNPDIFLIASFLASMMAVMVARAWELLVSINMKISIN